MVSRDMAVGRRNAAKAGCGRGSGDSAGAVADATESAAPRFVGAVAIALPAGLLVQALFDHASYRHPVVPVVVWLGMLVAAAWLLPRARTGDLSNPHAVVAIVMAVVAVTAIGLDRRDTGAAMQRGLDDPRGGLAARPDRTDHARPGCGSLDPSWSWASMRSSSWTRWGSARSG